jgi:type IV secretory pathway VirB3-like protein
MARDYRQLMRGEGVWIPRWVLTTLVLIVALWFAARIFLPPMWLVQQLDAPDGTRSARLYRSAYMKHHFVVKVRTGWFWQTAFYSQPLPDDLRLDLGERLRWSEDSRRVWLYMESAPVWGYDFERQQKLRLPESIE